MSEDVILTNREIDMAAHCGVMRNLACIVDGRTPYSYWRKEPLDTFWSIHIEGACGEVAVAKVLGVYWSPTLNTFKAADIGHTIGVRTRSKPNADLVVRQDDNPDYCYVLVTGKSPRFTVHGYLLGRDARRDEWFKSYDNGPAAWFVPQSALHPIEELRLKRELAS